MNSLILVECVISRLYKIKCRSQRLVRTCSSSQLFKLFPLPFQEILDGVTDIDMVVNLKLREDVLVEKCLGRRICNQCGKNFNVACIDVKGENGLPAIYMAPLLPPNNCMSKMTTRADDTEEVVRNRLRIYNDMVWFCFQLLAYIIHKFYTVLSLSAECVVLVSILLFCNVYMQLKPLKSLSFCSVIFQYFRIWILCFLFSRIETFCGERCSNLYNRYL